MTRGPKAWNGGSPEAAQAAADQRANDAAWTLRLAFIRAGLPSHPIGCTEPFTHPGAPGWIYLPVENVVIMAETAVKLRDLVV